MGYGGDGKGKGGWTPVWQLGWQGGNWGKGKGKGFGKGKGKGHRGFKIEQKVWVGGIPEDVTYKELHEHLKPAGAKWVEVFTGNGKGTGVACFASEDEAKNAIATLNGAPLNDAPLELDVWVRKPRDEQPPEAPPAGAPEAPPA